MTDTDPAAKEAAQRALATYNTNKIPTKITDQLDKAALPGVWRTVNLCTLQWVNGLPTVAVEHVLTEKFRMHDGTELSLSNWYIWDVTPAQLRELADQLERTTEPPK